ncbi:MAG TPA: hypothetical protein VIM96_02880 [Pseudomonadales bacterium]
MNEVNATPDIHIYSSRKLWELLATEANPAHNAPLANAIYAELYRRGDFQPRGWSAAA